MIFSYFSVRSCPTCCSTATPRRLTRRRGRGRRLPKPPPWPCSARSPPALIINSNKNQGLVVYIAVCFNLEGGGGFSDELHAKFILGILKSLVKLGR